MISAIFVGRHGLEVVGMDTSMNDLISRAGASFEYERLPSEVPTYPVTLIANTDLTGAEIRIYDLDNSPIGSLGSELAGVESAVSQTFAFLAASNNTIWIQIMKPGYEEFGLQVSTPVGGGTLSVQLAAELNN